MDIFRYIKDHTFDDCYKSKQKNMLEVTALMFMYRMGMDWKKLDLDNPEACPEGENFRPLVCESWKNLTHVGRVST